MRKNAGKMRTRITSNMDTFYAVAVSKEQIAFWMCFYLYCYQNQWDAEKIIQLQKFSYSSILDDWRNLFGCVFSLLSLLAIILSTSSILPEWPIFYIFRVAFFDFESHIVFFIHFFFVLILMVHPIVKYTQHFLFQTYWCALYV